MAADDMRIDAFNAGLCQRAAREIHAIRTGESHQHGETAFVDSIADETATGGADCIRQGIPPAIEACGKELHISRRRLGQRFGDDEERDSGRVVRPVDKRQAGYDLGRCRFSQPGPPCAVSHATRDPQEAEVSDGAGELGFFSPHSFWPFLLAFSIFIIGYGAAFWNWWVLIGGVVALIITASGLVFEYHWGREKH